jgi:hypothetical protein
MSWCELASWRGWHARTFLGCIAEKMKRKKVKEKESGIRPVTDGVFEMSMVYGSVQMFFSRWSCSCYSCRVSGRQVGRGAARGREEKRALHAV